MTYPEFPCSEAPLPPGEAPVDGCACKVCVSLRLNRDEPVRPGTPEWDALLEGARRG